MTGRRMTHRNRQGKCIIFLLLFGPGLHGIVSRVRAQCEVQKITPADGMGGDHRRGPALPRNKKGTGTTAEAVIPVPEFTTHQLSVASTF